MTSETLLADLAQPAPQGMGEDVSSQKSHPKLLQLMELFEEAETTKEYTAREVITRKATRILLDLEAEIKTLNDALVKIAKQDVRRWAAEETLRPYLSEVDKDGFVTVNGDYGHIASEALQSAGVVRGK